MEAMSEAIGVRQISTTLRIGTARVSKPHLRLLYIAGHGASSKMFFEHLQLLNHVFTTPPNPTAVTPMLSSQP